MWSFTLLWAIAALYLVIATADDDEAAALEVLAPLGKIKGSTLTTKLGKQILAFRGVRYAEPPIGLQRFQVIVVLHQCYVVVPDATFQN